MEKEVKVWEALDGELFIHKISYTEHNQKVIEKYTYFQNFSVEEEISYIKETSDINTYYKFLKIRG